MLRTESVRNSRFSVLAPSVRSSRQEFSNFCASQILTYVHTYVRTIITKARVGKYGPPPPPLPPPPLTLPLPLLALSSSSMSSHSPPRRPPLPIMMLDIYLQGFVAGCVLIVSFLVWLLYPTRPSPIQRHIPASGGEEEEDDLLLDVTNVIGPATGSQYLVIGCGCLGAKLVHSLLKRGETKIRVFDLRKPRNVDFERVEFVRGDLRNVEAMELACRGVDIVFHTAAIIRFMDSLPHQWPLSYSVNVQGTHNVIDACRSAHVPFLVQTSTSNVCVPRSWVGSGRLHTYDETTPYVTRANAVHHYAASKARAEEVVLAANGAAFLVNSGGGGGQNSGGGDQEGAAVAAAAAAAAANSNNTLSTVALRPCSGIFGAADNLMVEPALTKGETILLQPGHLLDMIYVDNVALAHILAADALVQGRSGVAGETFCISNDGAPPITVEDFYRALKFFYPVLKMSYLPRGLINFLCAGVSSMQWLLGPYAPSVGQLSLMNWTSLRAMSFDYHCISTKARRVLGYRPLFSIDQGLMRSVREFEAGRML